MKMNYKKLAIVISILLLLLTASGMADERSQQMERQTSPEMYLEDTEVVGGRVRSYWMDKGLVCHVLYNAHDEPISIGCT
ncbi:hypothetical protein LCGC14_2083940 [marine sediment metagenome]|uniref:Uncharacterized protein n=1 Tax=marine sediment metagenome TaxID=412755 RepID=A0A0F9EEL7_9ZZZZ